LAALSGEEQGKVLKEAAEALEEQDGIGYLLSLWNGSHPVLKRGWSDDPWEAEYVHDRITYTGKGFTALEALVEAHVDNLIANYYYSSDGPVLTLEQMNAWRAADYLAHLGYPAEGQYRGDYHPDILAAGAAAHAEGRG